MTRATSTGTSPVLLTPRLRIELAQPGHAQLHAEHFARNAVHFQRWDPPRGDVTSVGHWQRQLAAAGDEFKRGHSARWIALPLDDRQPLIARINYTQIVRGVFQSCMLGYAIDAGYEGQGLMAEALSATIAYMFGELKLHRIQANHRPENERSARLLARLGFVREGLAPGYLYIDGAWRDHVLNALINPRFDDRLVEPAASAGRSAVADV